MSMPLEAAQHTAIVARPAIYADENDRYLRFDDRGEATWTLDPADATSFDSMREAARAAFRLPASFRAYGLPRSVELSLATAH